MELFCFSFIYLYFCDRNVTFSSMESKKTEFTQPVGSFREAVRRQLAYQREKRERIALEEEYWQQEAERAKADPFYQIGSYESMTVSEPAPIREPDFKPGSFAKAIRAYRKYREEKRKALETNQTY
jgi:uncharacterized protein YjiS (DUF1127 family)